MDGSFEGVIRKTASAVPLPAIVSVITGNLPALQRDQKKKSLIIERGTTRQKHMERHTIE
jgi:hypothetical protein